eukprot:1220365-Pyramimonas_sp.AAC.1
MSKCWTACKTTVQNQSAWKPEMKIACHPFQDACYLAPHGEPYELVKRGVLCLAAVPVSRGARHSPADRRDDS